MNNDDRALLPSLTFPSTMGAAPLPEVGATFTVGGVATRLTVREAAIIESLDEPYEAVVEVLTEQEVPARGLPGREARLQMSRDERSIRSVPGVVRRVDDLGIIDGKHRLRFTVVPHLWLLSLRRDCRIFQRKNACEIIDAVLDAANLYQGPEDRSWARVRRDQYLQRDFCVQYQESDLAFVSRLLQEEGIAYLIDADGEHGERVSFFDSLSGAAQVPLLDGSPIVVRGVESRTARVESIRHFDWTDQLQGATVTLRDYDFTNPLAVHGMTATRSAPGSGVTALYDYPGRFTLLDEGMDPQRDHDHAYRRNDGGRRADVRLQQLLVEEHRGEGVGNAVHFAPGRSFEVAEHGRADIDRHRFVLRRVEHTFRASEATRGDAASGLPQSGEHTEGYLNRFECVAAEVAYRPRRVTPRPVVHGTQTATVVGPHGHDDDPANREDIHVDTHGRIKVQFHWDRAPRVTDHEPSPGDRNQGVFDEHRSGWIRVAQAWAGSQWGFVFIPRRGMEVVVDFLEGDPDRPIVVGCVYNNTHQTHYPLPEERTRSWIRTQSTPGDDPGKFNELLFEDRAGSEEVRIHAQRDFNERVRHDHSTKVTRNETITVGGNQTTTVGGNRTGVVRRNEAVTVQQSRELTVLQNDTVTVGENQTTIVGSTDSWSLPAPGAGAHVTGQLNVVVTEKIVVSVGGSMITIDSNGIEISTPGAIKISATGNTDILGELVRLNT